MTTMTTLAYASAASRGMVRRGKKRLSRMHRHLGGPEVSRCSRINIRKCPLSVPDERAGLLIIKNAAGGIRARMHVRVYNNRVCTVTVKVLVYGRLKSRKDTYIYIRTYVHTSERARHEFSFHGWRDNPSLCHFSSVFLSHRLIELPSPSEITVTYVLFSRSFFFYPGEKKPSRHHRRVPLSCFVVSGGTVPWPHRN